MLIPCPCCGTRERGEFDYGGDADVPVLAAPEADMAAEYQRLYLRANPRGLHREYWYHAAGCRRWFVLARDTATHAVAAGDPAA